MYRGGIRRSDGSRTSFTELAYEKKDECIELLCPLLECDDGGMKWGWGRDDNQPFAKYVIYIELPCGQVSFHCLSRYEGPDFLGEWDGSHRSEERIIEFCDRVFRENQ